MLLARVFLGGPVTESESNLSVGRGFGRYTLVRPIGRGGMAEIWKARIHGAQNFQRQVVVKKILPHLCLDPDLVHMFTAEAMLSGQLHHPNIVQVFELAEVEGELYLAMEYVQGVNLAELLKRLDGVPIPVGMAAYLVREVALALGYAHALTDEDGRPLSIIHRDVSPSNVMVGYDGSVKLVDFGVAQARTTCFHAGRAEAPGDPGWLHARQNASSGRLEGKTAYMSPEAIAGRVELDGRTDIFAAGVLLHELLTARRLFRAASDTDTMALVRACKVQPPSRTRAEVPPQLDQIVCKALARDRGSRHRTADELAAALSEVVVACAWDRLRTADFLRAQGIRPGGEPPGGSGEELTAKAWPPPETKRITVVERRPRSGVIGLPHRRTRRLRWALTGVAALALTGAALALGLRLSRADGPGFSPAPVAPSGLPAPGPGPGLRSAPNRI